MNKEQWFEADGKRVDVSKATRIYPAALIHAGGESASVSLEWAELKADVIQIEAYVLICDVDPIGEVPVNRVEFRFATQAELFAAMETMAGMLNP